MPRLPTATLGALAAALGPLGAAVERGQRRPLSWAGGLGLAALAAASHLLTLLVWRGAADPGDLLLRGAAVLVLGAALTRLGPRLDRGEEGWREAARAGPPVGATPLAWHIAGLRPPRPLAWLLLPLLPLALGLRALCLAAILAYQLTLSRLMPPACRYEPSCSRYGFLAFLRHGVLRGGLLTTLRLVRCSPIGTGGHDPVPPSSARGWRRVWWGGSQGEDPA